MKRWLIILLVFLYKTRNISSASSGFFGDPVQIIRDTLTLGGSSSSFAKDIIKFNENEVHDTTPSENQVYDFIIIGGGSAGSTLTSRLTEIEDATVLLIEAGGHENLIMDIPILAVFLQLNYDINWNFLYEPSNDFCLAVDNHQCRAPKGKTLGGCSAINFAIATRGSIRDWNTWAAMTGDASWSYGEMLKYFKKMESCDVNKVQVDRQHHGFEGPIRIVNPPYITPLGEAFIQAGYEMGLPLVDFNGGNITGFSYMQSNQINGEKLSANRAYLHPIRNRKNLFVTIRSKVTKILIDSQTRTAYGVEFVKRGRKIGVFARKEVILSAGAVESPKLLMLSGIGPAEHLQQFNIDVLADLPVGENLMDHIAYNALVFLINDTVSIVSSEYHNLLNPSIKDYFTKRTGKMSTASGVEGLIFINVDDMNPNNDYVNMELEFCSISLLSDPFVRMTYGYTNKYWDEIFADKLYHHAWTMYPVLLKPKSRGKIFLRSSNPHDKPKIFPNYLADPDDIRVSIKGIRLAIEISKTKAFQKYNSQFLDRTVPGCEGYVYDSDAYWECALRTYTSTVWHLCGTNKMGRVDDPTAVVNTKLQVKYINRLRVVDTSIMPEIISGHLNIPMIAIAEKIADVIKSDWGYIR